MYRFILILLLVQTVAQSCDNDNAPSKDEKAFFSEYESRNFSMGFTSWSFGPNPQDVANTYNFLAQNSDIYTEHIDNKIPWKAWINDTKLPKAFVDEIAFRKSNKIDGMDMLLSISILTSDRSELAEDFDGKLTGYDNINDEDIVNAYFKHVDYLVTELAPTYLVIAIESNELLLHSKEKWEQYQLLIAEVTNDISIKYPDLMISESMTLHNLFEPEVTDVDAYLNELIAHMNELDFVAISFYPFFKLQQSSDEFQKSMDFLHSNIDKPIAFVETAHLAEDLEVEGLNLFIPGNENQQDDYLKTLLTNAQDNNYLFVIWWAHRDFDTLWETFPEEVKDLGKLWRDTGLLDEGGKEREAFKSWSAAFAK